MAQSVAQQPAPGVQFLVQLPVSAALTDQTFGTHSLELGVHKPRVGSTNKEGEVKLHAWKLRCMDHSRHSCGDSPGDLDRFSDLVRLPRSQKVARKNLERLLLEGLGYPQHSYSQSFCSGWESMTAVFSAPRHFLCRTGYATDRRFSTPSNEASWSR